MPSWHAQEQCYHVLYLSLIFSAYSRHWMIEMKEFFTPYLLIFLHGVYICSTYIPSWCEHLLHLYAEMCTVLLPPGFYPIAVKYIISYAFMVCSSTLPIVLYCMPIDLVIVIKKVQYNVSFSLLQLCRWVLYFAGMWPQNSMVHARM